MLPLFQDNFILVEATSSHFFRVTISRQQLLFWDSYFFRTSKKEVFQSRHFCATSAFSEKLQFGKNNFSENQFLHYLLFQESCLFRATTFSKDAAFYSSYFSRRATFLQHSFSEELLFHSYGSFPQLHFLFIR